MSFQAMTWATEQNVPAMQKIVLLMLANCANNATGQCNPSYDRLAKDCGMSLRACKEQIAILAQLGLLMIQNRSVEGVSLPNQYTLAMNVVVVQEAHPVVQEAHYGSAPNARGVVRQMHTNQEVEPVIEPVKTKTKRSVAAPSFDALEFLIASGVEKQIAMDWLQVRRGKRAANTKTAFLDVLAKISDAGMPFDDALRICCSRGWAGFDGAWVENRQQPRASPAAKFDPLAYVNRNRIQNHERTIDLDATGEPILEMVRATSGTR